MKYRVQVERTVTFTDFVEIELTHAEDTSKDREIKSIVKERSLSNQSFDYEELEIVDVMLV